MKLIAPDFWRKRNILAYSLWPLSLITQFMFFLKTQLSSKKQFNSKIITVGNITLGGAGKTPTAMALAKLIKQNFSKKVVILTRGYLGSLNGPELINNSYDVNLVGDEALMMSLYTEVCVAKDRIKGINFLEKLGFDYIITDDGFQDLRFVKNLNILVVDQDYKFGNQILFPAGPLRQTVNSALKLADFAVIIGNNNAPVLALKNLKQINAKLQAKTYQFAAKSFFAFAGIANPNKFLITLSELNLQIIDYKFFPDHYQYCDSEIAALCEQAKAKNAMLITTEKDFMRIPKKWHNDISFLPVKLIWYNQENIEEMIKNL